MRNHGVFVVVCRILMFSRDARGGCVDVLVVHYCDDVAVLVQSLTYCGAAIPPLLLYHPPPPLCVCVWLRVTGMRCDALCEEQGLRPRGGGETHRSGSDVVAVMRWCLTLAAHPLSSMPCVLVRVCVCVCIYGADVCADCCCAWSPGGAQSLSRPPPMRCAQEAA